MAAEDDDADIQ